MADMDNAGNNDVLKQIPIAWGALEDAFENNAPEVHSYLQMSTGEVIRVVDGIADPTMHGRIAVDADYLRIDPVSSREQYRWMERFITEVEDLEVRKPLLQSIDGKGAFRRFKDVLMGFPEEREKWFSFRSERLSASMHAWLNAHGIDAVARPTFESDSDVSSVVSNGITSSAPGPIDGAEAMKVEAVAQKPSVTTEVVSSKLGGVKDVVVQVRKATGTVRSGTSRESIVKLLEKVPEAELPFVEKFLKFVVK